MHDDAFVLALEQARVRWGPRAIVSESITVDGEGRREVVRFVGRHSHDAFAWSVLGQGPSWSQAFAEADHKERMERG